MEALLYTWGFNLILLYSVAQTVTALVTGRSFNWLFCPFGILLLLCFCFFFFFFFFATATCSRLILCISYPNGRINHVSKKPWFFLMENGIRNQNMHIRCSHCYWGFIASRPSQLTEQLDIDLHLSIYVYIYKYLQVYLRAIVDSVPDHYKKANIATKSQIFLFSSALKSYAYTTLQSIKCTKVSYLKNNVHTLILKNTFICVSIL